MEWLHNIPSSSKNMFLIFDFKVILFCFCLLYMFKHHIFRWTVLNSKHNTQMFNVFNIFHGIIIRLFSCWRYVVHYFTVFLNVNKERTIWWCHMTSSNWQFWPWNTRHQKSKPKKKKKMQLGSTSNIFVVCQQCCEWSGYAESYSHRILLRLQVKWESTYQSVPCRSQLTSSKLIGSFGNVLDMVRRLMLWNRI